MKLNIDLIIPEKLAEPFGWIGHIPFIQWLIKNYKPKKYVELGTHKGNSYFAVCQAVKKYGTKTECFAVDSWKGEEHAGYYDDDVYKEVNEWNKNNYNEFSVLIKAFFDDALCSFKDNSIDMLHIDGFHTYEAVKHDFEAWLPKLTDNSIVLFHDINVQRDDFGVYKLWEELKYQYKTFSFMHSYGLGVLFNGNKCNSLSKELQFFFNAENSNQKYLVREQFVSQFSVMNDAFMSAQANSWDKLPESYLFYKDDNFDHDKCCSKKIIRSENDNSFELDFELNSTQRVKKFRWYPIDGIGCKLSKINIIVYGECEKAYSLNECQTNGVVDEGELSFYTIDPIVEFVYNGYVSKVVIYGCIEYISTLDIDHYHNRIKRNIEEALLTKDEKIINQRLIIENINNEKKKLWNAIINERKRKELIFSKLKLAFKIKKIYWALKNPKTAFRYKNRLNIIRNSFFFNNDFYLSSNIDLFLRCFDPADHYFRYGWKENRNPSEYFDTSFYVDNNPDIFEKKVEPLFHYLTFGWKEGRNSYPLFDVNYYKNKYIPNNKKDQIEPFEHYIKFGWKKGNNPNTFFDVDVYLKNANINEEPLLHYKKFGLANDIAFTNDKVLREYIIFLNKIKNGKGLEFLLLNQDLFRHININELTFNNLKKGFLKNVTIVVPIFVRCRKSLDVLRNLVDSLKMAYPIADEFISFTIVDDASSEKAVFEYYNREDFFKRKDVLLLLRDKNKGFLPTVNYGIELSNKYSDIVILNSDTEIFSGTFETLQNVAYRDRFVASVTPLSNKAILSSITNWPHGDETIFQIPNYIVAEIIRAVGLKTPEIEVPTGHGFCMYMKREVIDQVGIFREDLYGRGYGEENDWCQRAIKKGYKNLITTECYVFHNDTTSFTEEEKKHQAKKNIIILNKEFPYYNKSVVDFIKKDSFKEYRVLLKIELLKHLKSLNNLKTVIFFLHDSVESSFGGTQKHVKDLSEMLKASANVEIFIFSPTLYNNYENINVHYISNLGFKYNITMLFRNAFTYLKHLENRIDVIHVHHFQRMPQEILNFITFSNISKKVITLHDYAAFCDNMFLLKNDYNLCDIKNLNSCESCGKDDNHTRIYYYLLKFFETIFVPSGNMYKMICSMNFVDADVKEKIFILNHFLPFEKEISKTQDNTDGNKNGEKKIVFLGAAGHHKGIDLFLSIVPLLREEGYTPEIWGENGNIEEVNTCKYQGWRELYELHKSNSAYIVVMPSFCPETFSFTLFESACILKIPVVVGPYGNPADIVIKNKIGISLERLEREHFLNSIRMIDENYESYIERIHNFVQNGIEKYKKDYFLKKYLSAIDCRALGKE